MAAIQIRLDDNIKTAADSLFSALGLDTSTAIRMFIAAAIEHDGIPFAVKRSGNRLPKEDLMEAMENVQLNHNDY